MVNNSILIDFSSSFFPLPNLFLFSKQIDQVIIHSNHNMTLIFCLQNIMRKHCYLSYHLRIGLFFLLINCVAVTVWEKTGCHIIGECSVSNFPNKFKTNSSGSIDSMSFTHLHSTTHWQAQAHWQATTAIMIETAKCKIQKASTKV